MTVREEVAGFLSENAGLAHSPVTQGAAYARALALLDRLYEEQRADVLEALSHAEALFLAAKKWRRVRIGVQVRARQIVEAKDEGERSEAILFFGKTKGRLLDEERRLARIVRGLEELRRGFELGERERIVVGEIRPGGQRRIRVVEVPAEVEVDDVADARETSTAPGRGREEGE